MKFSNRSIKSNSLLKTKLIKTLATAEYGLKSFVTALNFLKNGATKKNHLKSYKKDHVYNVNMARNNYMMQIKDFLDPEMVFSTNQGKRPQWAHCILEMDGNKLILGAQLEERQLAGQFLDI